LIGRLSIDIADKVFKGDTADIVNPMPIECEFASFENIDQYLAQ